MSDHDVSTRDRETLTSDRVEQFIADVNQLRIPSQVGRRERTLLAVGVAITVAGFISIGLGWWGASGTKYVYQEIPYVISGAIFGAALVVVGAALFARYSAARLLRFWLARLVADQQTQTDRIVDAIATLVESLRPPTTTVDDEAT
jgi:uncharacterized membrane protein